MTLAEPHQKLPSADAILKVFNLNVLIAALLAGISGYYIYWGLGYTL